MLPRLRVLGACRSKLPSALWASARTLTGASATPGSERARSSHDRPSIRRPRADQYRHNARASRTADSAKPCSKPQSNAARMLASSASRRANRALLDADQLHVCLLSQGEKVACVGLFRGQALICFLPLPIYCKLANRLQHREAPLPLDLSSD